MKVSYEIVENMDLFKVLNPKLKTVINCIDLSLEDNRKVSLHSMAGKDEYKFCINELNKQCDKLNLVCVFDDFNRVYSFNPKNPYSNNSNYDPIVKSMRKAILNK